MSLHTAKLISTAKVFVYVVVFAQALGAAFCHSATGCMLTSPCACLRVRKRETKVKALPGMSTHPVNCMINRSGLMHQLATWDAQMGLHNAVKPKAVTDCRDYSLLSHFISEGLKSHIISDHTVLTCFHD